MAMAAARRALLAHLRVPAVHPAAAGGTIPAARRLLSSTTEETKGSFLDKGEVADRVLSVVKNFQKVEPSKVSGIYLFLGGCLCGCPYGFVRFADPDLCWMV
jgi:NADH dehydrogenase (ubiquinone) 1 alpha/beta subcomplex 1